MSEFLKFSYEVLSQVVYNLSAVFLSIFKLLITGWIEYFSVFFTYFPTLSILGKILSVLLMAVLIAVPILMLAIAYKRHKLHTQLKLDKEDNASLYKEIGRLNKQVLNLIEEKNKILALKVNAMGGTERIPYMGASALTDDVVPTLENVTGTREAGANAVINANNVTVAGKGGGTSSGADDVERFPKLSLVDKKYREFVYPVFDTQITLQQFAENYRSFAAGNMKLYYTPEVVRRFIAGMAASKLLILEGISGTGKTSLPYSFSRYLDNPATLVSVQPSFRDRTEILGYFNEFSKRFNETEFLRAVYEANYRLDPTFIVLDEMNLARIEYYFAEMLSVLEMPSQDEWILDLVPTAWPKDPIKLEGGKIKVPASVWYIGTANNDDSTFTITDKVYDRAIPIELNERAEPFDCPPTEKCHITYEHLTHMFEKAWEDYAISRETLEKMNKLDNYLQTRFKLAFGNRIIKQMHDFIPVYVACGGSEMGGMDYIIARKVLKKFESLNVSFVRDEIKGLIEYIDRIFGREYMPDSVNYLTRIQNLY